MADDKKELIEEIAGSLAKETADELNVTFDDLKNAAQVFINKINEVLDIQGFDLQKKERNYSVIDQYIANLDTKKNNFMSLYQIMKQGTSPQYQQKLQETLTAQHTFEKYVDNFLNRKIYYTFIDENGQIFILDEVSTEILFNEGFGAGEGRGSVKTSVLNEILNNLSLSNTEKNLADFINNESLNKREIYKEAIRRYEHTKAHPGPNKNDSEAMKYKISRDKKVKQEDGSYTIVHTDNNAGSFWWRTGKTSIHHTGIIQNKGRIGEAYAEAIINRKMNATNNEIEKGLKELASFIDQEHSAGIQRGDVKLSEDGRIQFAIKLGSFNTAKIGPTIYFALNILALGNRPFTPEQLEKLLEKSSGGLAGLSQKIEAFVDRINNDINTTVDDIVNEYLNEKKKKI